MPHAHAPGARLHYEVTGSGTPIVFVHETCADLRSWEAQLRWFSRGYRCIAYNARGYPGSERGADPSTHDHRRLAADIGAVMDAVGVDKAFVVGHSMGAYMAAQFMLDQPERLLGVVLEGLGAGSDDPRAFRAATLAMAAALRRDGIEPLVAQMAGGANRVQLEQKDPRGFAAFLDHLREIDPVALANVHEHCHSRRPPIYEFAAPLQASRVPVLVVVGDEDTPCLAPAVFLKHNHPGAGLWVAPRSGHAVSLEEPAQFNDAVQRFIDQVMQGRWRPRDLRSDARPVLELAAR